MQECPQISPERLMVKFQRRLDSKAFERIVSRYSGPALTVAQQILVDRALAEDAVQEAFLHIVRKRHQYMSTKPFSHWFYAILRNICIDMLRKRQRHMKAIDEIVDSFKPSKKNPADSISAEELLQSLPAIEQAVLELRIIHDMSFHDIAAAIDISTEAAKKRAQRGLKRLREKLNASKFFNQHQRIQAFAKKPSCN